MTLFWKAFLIGLSIAAPVGPIGVLCIQRSLAEGWYSGLLTGLGAATADGVYGLIGALGSGALIAMLIGQRQWIGAVGGAFLVLLGLRTIARSLDRAPAAPVRPAASAGRRPHRAGAWQTFAGTFALTLSNPMTILAFVAIFASLGAGAGTAAAGAAIPAAATASVATMVLGVFAGSAAWWLLLSGSIATLGRRIPPAALTTIDRASGGLLVLLGLWQLRLAFVAELASLAPPNAAIA